MRYLKIAHLLLLIVLLSACNKSPISGLRDALISYQDEYSVDIKKELDGKSPNEVKEYLSKREDKLNKLQERIENEAAKLDGAVLPVADGQISEVEPLRMTLVNNGRYPEFRLNGKFKIEKDIELKVWNEYSAEHLKNGELARVDLASPKIEESGVQNSFTYTPLAFVSAIPVSVENGVLVAKTGTVIEINDAKLRFDPSKADVYRKASKLWLEPAGIPAK